MAANDLTTLPAVKDWLTISNPDSDAILRRLITAASRFALSYISRPSLVSQEYSDIYNGFGQTFMMLRQFPVTSIQSLQFGGATVMAATGQPPVSGYVLEPWDGIGVGSSQQLTLFGYQFPNARSSIYVTYTAGYLKTDEAHTVSTDDDNLVTPDLIWAADGGVTLADGTALTYVTGDAPGDGEYVITDGVYGFNAAQDGADILITYSFTPADISEAVCELVGERFKIKDRIGMNSKTLGGQETISYSTKDMNDFVRDAFQRYMRVAPW